jgi:hypothetical protein
VRLEQLAGVQAAVAEGIPLAAVLAQEGISETEWPAAERVWRQAIASSPELQISLVHKRREAEDALARPIDPLDADPEAWVGLLGALALALDMGSVLEPLGLRVTDVSRLGRAWSRKAAADPELSKKLVSLAATARAPTSVRADPLVLKPFPWTPQQHEGETAREPKPATGAAAAGSARRLTERVDGRMPVEIDADLFAALEVVLELVPSQSAEWLAACGVDAARFAEIATSWRQRARADADLRAELTVRGSDHRAALRAILAGRRPVLRSAT